MEWWALVEESGFRSGTASGADAVGDGYQCGQLKSFAGGAERPKHRRLVLHGAGRSDEVGE